MSALLLFLVIALLMRPVDLAAEPDWAALGLVLLLVGTFLLGNALLFRHPRELVAERLGARPPRQPAIREQIFQRLQVTLGFAALLGGFALELFARFRPPPDGGPRFPLFWVAALALVTVVFLALGWAWSSRAYRRYVREQMLREPPDLESDPRLAREVGELYGVEAEPEDSVASYAERVRRAVGLPPVARGWSRQPPQAYEPAPPAYGEREDSEG